MINRSVCYDVTRLLTRVLDATPNGIDRIDVTLAQHFLAQPETDGLNHPAFGTASTGFGSRLMSQSAARDAVTGIVAHWGDHPDGDGADAVYDGTIARITGARHIDVKQMGARHRPQERRPSTLASDIRSGVAWVARHGLPLWRRPQTELPQRSLYVNVSQFPLWIAGSFTWLEARRDIRPVFFIHDLLPVSMPEYFPGPEFERHNKRLANVARFAAAALTATQAVADDLTAHMAGLGRHDLPILTAPVPVAALFREPRRTDPRLAAHPFFLLCSTIEPRKNHLMILATWRDLVRRMGPDAPKLVLVGTLGWKYELILDLIERSPPLRDHVIAVRGLSSPGLKRLMDNAAALLMPSFAEGYGLPVHEAIAAGCPVVASDIPVFRGLEASDVTLLSPLDGEAWLETIVERTRQGRPPGDGLHGEADVTWQAYFGKLDGFLEGL